MPVKIIVTSQKFNDQLLNGTDFSINPDTNFATNLIGISGERIRVRQTVEVSAYAQSSASNKFYYSPGGGGRAAYIEMQTGNWFKEGFAPGDLIAITLSSFPDFISQNQIASLTESRATLVGGDALGSDYFTDMRVINYQTPDALEYRFGLADNSETAEFINIVTGEAQRFYSNNFTLGIPKGAISSGLEKSWVDGSLSVNYIDSYASTRAYISIFEITHDFILPYYRDGDFSALSNRQSIDIYAEDKTLKYTNNYSFQSLLSNPTGAKQASNDFTLGSCGGFGETFNGFQSNYEITDIVYIDADTLAPFEALKSVGRTKVTINAHKKDGVFETGERVGLYVSYLPTSEEYTGTKTDFVENFMYQNCFCEIGGASVTNGYIYTMQATKVGADLTVTFDVELSVAQQLRLYDKDSPNYLIGLQMCTVTLPLVSSDKVIELADVNTFSNELILEGLAQSDGIEILEHDKSLSDTGFTTFEGWIEDGILSRFKFSLDLSKQAKILSLSQKLIAYNAGNPFKNFDLDKTIIPLAGIIEVDGVQQLEIDKTKGYPLASSDEFNLLTFRTLAKTGDLQQYEIIAGQKLTWQAWQKIKADSSFFNKTLPQNGFNRKSNRYSEVNDFSVCICYTMALGGVDDQGREGITEYNFISSPIIVKDYLHPSGWNATIETFDPETMESLNKSVITDRPTLFRITWEKIGEPITDITGYYCINRIEVSGQGGMGKFEISTIATVADNSPLVPLDGDSQLSMRLDSGKVVAECLIDPDKINMNNGLNLSGRIAEAHAVIPLNAKIMEDYTPKLTEDEIYKILD